MICIFAVWILTLPIFPAQDGPMHRYYIHVLDAVLHGDSVYSVYRIRHPFPPYATHYATVLGLSHLVSYDVAEKIFAVAIVFTFGYGLRFCARQSGPAGDVLSFFVAPLLLHWALMMGFMNYSLALGMFLFLAGFWQKAMRGHSLSWIAFAVLVCVLTVTHPVPLLLLIALCGFDLLLRAGILRNRAASISSRHLLFAFGALLFCLLAFKVPAAALEKHAATSVFADMGFQVRPTVQKILLQGLSPYYNVSHSILINLYRVFLYAILIGCFVVSAKTFRTHWQARALTFSDSFFLGTILLAIAIPILPDYVNGSGYFATRMLVLVWVGILIAASGAQAWTTQRASSLRLVALVGAALTLLSAQIYFRPVANALAQVENEPVPEHTNALILSSLQLDDYVHHHYQVAFDPFAWGPALAFVHRNDAILDSPWIDQNIAPLQAVPGSPLLVDDIRLTPLSKTDHGFRVGASLPLKKEAGLVDRSSVILYSDSPAELDKGLGEQLLPEDAAKYRCTRKEWYLVCVSVGAK